MRFETGGKRCDLRYIDTKRPDVASEGHALFKEAAVGAVGADTAQATAGVRTALLPVTLGPAYANPSLTHVVVSGAGSAATFQDGTALHPKANLVARRFKILLHLHFGPPVGFGGFASMDFRQVRGVHIRQDVPQIRNCIAIGVWSAPLDVQPTGCVRPTDRIPPFTRRGGTRRAPTSPNH